MRSRSAALIVAARWLAGQVGLPIVLSELGASAGLNLIFDPYGLQTPGGRLGPADAKVVLAPDWRGAPATGAEPRIAARAGVDLAPRDPAADRLRLLSYVWADQPDRPARIAAALDDAAALRPGLAQGNAVDWLQQRLARDWLEQRLAQPQPGHLHLVLHTVAWQYFPKAQQARGEALLAMTRTACARLKASRTETVIPSTRSRKRPIPHDAATYAGRNMIERAFCRSMM